MVICVKKTSHLFLFVKIEFESRFSCVFLMETIAWIFLSVVKCLWQGKLHFLSLIFVGVYKRVTVYEIGLNVLFPKQILLDTPSWEKRDNCLINYLIGKRVWVLDPGCGLLRCVCEQTMHSWNHENTVRLQMTSTTVSLWFFFFLS